MESGYLRLLPQRIEITDFSAPELDIGVDSLNVTAASAVAFWQLAGKS